MPSAAWLKNNYKLITLDELAGDPVAAAEDLYKFIGYDSVPESVRWWLQEHGRKKLDLMEGQEEYTEQWNKNLTRRVEEECRPLIMKMGLQFQELDIKYTHSYH